MLEALLPSATGDWSLITILDDQEYVEGIDEAKSTRVLNSCTLTLLVISKLLNFRSLLASLRMITGIAFILAAHLISAVSTPMK
jgi:hypothetical protein